MATEPTKPTQTKPTQTKPPQTKRPPTKGGRNQQAPSRAPLLIAIVVALVVGAAIIAVVSSLGGDDTADGGATNPGAIVTGSVTVDGASLPATEDFTADPAVGRPFPGLAGQNVLDGTPLAITADGTPKVVVFLAHWCPHCQAEVPSITDWLAENGQPEGVELYAVSTGVAESRGNYPPASWLQAEGWPIPTMADSEGGDAANAVGLSAYPFFVVVDAAGNVVAHDSGELTMERFAELVDLARRA